MKAKMKSLIHIKKLWQLLELALSDFEKVKKDPKYIIDMDRWHSPDDKSGKCAVCLAGAVMAKSLGVKRSEYKTPFNEDIPDLERDDLENKLTAIDSFRVSYYGDMFIRFYGEPKYEANYTKYKKIIKALGSECNYNHTSKAIRSKIKILKEANV